MQLEFRDLDECSSYAELVRHPEPHPGEELSAAALESRECLIIPPEAGGLRFNWGARGIPESLLDLLVSLGEEQQLVPKYRALASGAVMNTGENRKVLHHLLRGELAGPVLEGDRHLGAFYREQRDRVLEFAAKVRAGTITAPGGRRFRTVVQVGIGGSDLGPRALYLALAESGIDMPLRAEFISNVDPDDASSVLSRIDPAESLFVVVSKSGTTQETLTNQAFVEQALRERGLEPTAQMLAVTSESSPMAEPGRYLDAFFIDDSIGGRYSATSAVGLLVLALTCGPDAAEQILAGAHAADRAAMEPDLRKNAAALDALFGLWERSVLGHSSTAILPYSQALHRFPAHLQQLDMESNGKRVNRDGRPLAYQTGPIVFGEPGTNGQHSFYQLLHQGTTVVPLQFIGFLHSQRGHDISFAESSSQEKLNANLAAQIQAFARGQENSNQNKHFPGGRPVSLIYGPVLDAVSLGALLAHFENKVMFQGFLWNINSFDQEGVQLGKVLTKQVLGTGEIDPALERLARMLGARSHG